MQRSEAEHALKVRADMLDAARYPVANILVWIDRRALEAKTDIP
ncbi:hypothetical protein [Variovorax sp. LT1R16]